MPKLDVLLHGSPLRTDVGIVGFCSVILIEGQKRILVDVGHVGRRSALLNALAQRGLTPEDIDITVMTHAHWDHGQNFDLFQHAPMLIHPWERRYAHHPHRNDWATPAWSGAMIEFQPQVVEVEEGYQLEPGVTVLHTPGHSPGSVSLLVETDDGQCAITGDVLHYATVALTGQNPLVFWNEADARRSITRLVAASDLIYPGHDRPFRLVQGEIEYLAQPRMTVAGLDPNDPSITFDHSPRAIWIMPGIEEQKL